MAGYVPATLYQESEVENMSKALDLTGERYGNLTVIKRVENSKNGHSNWLCKCDCGNYTTVHSGHLREKRGTKTCGCSWKKVGERTYKHGMKKTRLYRVWNGIKKRCFNENEPSYPQYGGRGITVCDEWKNDFQAFYDWAITNGYDKNSKRGECTIDRIDVNGNYEPSNCRWVDMKIQSRNRRNTIYIEQNGEKISLIELCEKQDLNYSRVQSRMARGKNFEKAKINSNKDLRYKNAGKEKNLLPTLS